MKVRTVRAPLPDDDTPSVQASLDGQELLIIQAPDSRENHYPERWIMECIQRWNPLLPKT